MHSWSRFKLLVALSFRSIFTHWVKSFIVGIIMAFGTLLVVLGSALLGSIESSMSAGIISSLSGHLQVYAKDTPDKLALFGGGFMGSEDIGRMESFEKVRDALADLPNVQAVIPMGIDMATVTSPGELERALEQLRAAVHAEDRESIALVRAQVRELASKLIEERKAGGEIMKSKETIAREVETISPVTTDDFWNKFDEDPLGQLEYLDTKVAPLTDEGRLIYFRYLGTDPALFKQNFDRFELVSGEMMPPGERGFLFNHKYYDQWVKHYVARSFDKIHRGLFEESKTIKGDAALQALVRQTKRQYRRISYQLDAKEAAEVEQALKALLPSVQGDLEAKLQAFLDLDDENFKTRYDFFYREIAPKVELYDVKVGETMTIRAFTRAGFLKAVNVKLYGTFKFRGLEKSDLAGDHSLVDIVTFRELYGLMSEEKQAELDAIQEEMKLADVDRASAEEELFGEERAVVAAPAAPNAGFDEFEGINLAAQSDQAAMEMRSTFTQAEIDQGLALNAAVKLKDPSQLKETQLLVQKALDEANLGLRVVDWQEASGFVGQLIYLFRFVLYLMILVAFTVALVIINNSMTAATMERTTEIGTMRAIGAGRSLVVSMFMLETILLGLMAGAAGAGLGALAVQIMGHFGIPAQNDVLTFFFGGPRLYPTVSVSNLVFAGVVILFVSVLSTLYPAYMAARIQPAVAMVRKE